MGGLLSMIQWGRDWAGPQPAQAPPLLAVPNVSAQQSTASVSTSYYSMWPLHCEGLSQQRSWRTCMSTAVVYCLVAAWQNASCVVSAQRPLDQFTSHALHLSTSIQYASTISNYYYVPGSGRVQPANGHWHVTANYILRFPTTALVSQLFSRLNRFIEK